MARGPAGGLFVAAAVLIGIFASGRGDNSPKPPAPSYTASTSTAASLPDAAPAVSVQAPTVAPATSEVPPAIPAKARPRLVISGHKVPMRVDPTPKARIIDRLSQGLVVEEIDRTDGWVKVRYPLTTAQGWVKVSLTRATTTNREVKPAAATPKRPAVPALATSVVVARIIAASRADYPGNCACPDDRDKRGHRCGRRSAYSRPGGYAPLCYPKDVTSAMIDEYRRTHTTASQ